MISFGCLSFRAQFSNRSSNLPNVVLGESPETLPMNHPQSIFNTNREGQKQRERWEGDIARVAQEIFDMFLESFAFILSLAGSIG